MLQFTRDHRNNKKGDIIGYDIDHIDYLIRVGVLVETDNKPVKAKPKKKK